MSLALVNAPPRFVPRKSQGPAKQAFLDYTGDKGALIVLPTGTGKTATGHYIAADYLDRGERVLWLADQTVLVDQPRKALERWWPEHAGSVGVVQGGRNENPAGRIVYASKDTVKNERRMRQILAAGPFALVVADEAHRSVSPTWLRVLREASHDNTRLLGLTATPHREDTKNLSDLWEIVFSYPILQVFEDGDLVPPWAAVDKVPHLDLSEVKTKQGDYDPGQLGEALLKAHIVDHTAAAMGQSYLFEELPFREKKTFASLRGRQVLVHTATREQARLTAEALNADGWTARYVSGDTSMTDINRLFHLFRERKINVLLAAQKLSTGVDLPEADAEVFASPTRSWTLYIQRLGRGLRSAADKDRCLVLDFVGCTRDHNIVSAPVLVDGIDCPKHEDGKHHFIPIDGTGEGRCDGCGKVIKCMKRMAGHEFKDGHCKACGLPQCEQSPDHQHQWVAWEEFTRRCVHCERQIPDPMSALVDRSPSQREPVDWQDLGRNAWGASLGKIGTLFTVQKGSDLFTAFLLTRGRLVPLSHEPVRGAVVRMLTDDVARRATKVNGMYGGIAGPGERIAIARMRTLAEQLNVREA